MHKSLSFDMKPTSINADQTWESGMNQLMRVFIITQKKITKNVCNSVCLMWLSFLLCCTYLHSFWAWTSASTINLPPNINCHILSLSYSFNILMHILVLFRHRKKTFEFAGNAWIFLEFPQLWWCLEIIEIFLATLKYALTIPT